MPAFPHIVTYWSSIPNGVGGYAFGAPTTIKAFWVDKKQAIEDSQGRLINSNAIVYTETDVALEGYIFLGTSAASDPTSISNAFRILKYDVNYALNGETRLRKAYL